MKGTDYFSKRVAAWQWSNYLKPITCAFQGVEVKRVLRVELNKEADRTIYPSNKQQ